MTHFLDSVMVLGRIITILPLLLCVGLFMGKRSIGELPVFDFLVVLVLGSVVGADIADPKINHIHTVVAIIAIALLQKFIVFVKMNNRKLGRLFTFEPTIVIYKGKFLTRNLTSIHYSIDNILQMLREKDVFRIEEVDMAIVEANGKLSVRLLHQKDTVTREDMGVPAESNTYEVPVILDGEFQYNLMERMHKSEDWVRDQLVKQDVPDVSRVFYASLNEKDELYISLKDYHPDDVPLVDH